MTYVRPDDAAAVAARFAKAQRIGRTADERATEKYAFECNAAVSERHHGQFAESHHEH
jgi:hypothetical protein